MRLKINKIIKKVSNFKMKKILAIIGFTVLIINIANAAIANCSNGECEFNFSNHYKYGKTHCLQTISYEPVETDILSFVILKTGQKCEITESSE